MNGQNPHRSEPFVEPGSKEDEELTQALIGALDEVARHNEGRNRMPQKETYFFTNADIPVRDEDLDLLWKQSRVAIHCPSDDSRPDPESLDPKNYPTKPERKAVEIFRRLTQEGGYVWSETRTRRSVRVGRVEPATEVEIVDAARSGPPQPRLGANTESARLKTLWMADPKELGPEEAMALRAVRPLGKQSRPWTNCGSRLVALVEERDVERVWSNLRPELRIALCAEYLRHHDNPHCPRLDHLLLPAVNRDPGKLGKRDPYDVDVFGLAEDGTEILAQVPTRDDTFKHNQEMGRKIERLEQLRGPGRTLVCFGDFGTAEPGGTSLVGPQHFLGNNILYLPLAGALTWAEKHPAYAERLFSA